MKVLRKIDESGVYTSYPGVTVISSVRNEDKGLWERVYNSIANLDLVCQYYSALPHESYHMTTMDLYTRKREEERGNNWQEFVNNKSAIFHDLSTFLRNHEFHPEVTFEKVIFPGAIILIVKLAKEQEELIERLNKESVSRFHFAENAFQEFHITLAYQYKLPSEEVKEIMEREITQRLKQSLESRTITLNAPTLCYFHDMTAFISWDGTSRPFERTQKEEGESLSTTVC